VSALIAANLGLRFVLELCALAALGYWGFRVDGGAVVRIGLGIGAPVLAAVAWGAVVAPKAPLAIPPPVRWAVEGVVCGLAVAGLVATGNSRLAWRLAVVWLVNRALLAVTERGAGAPPR